MTTDAYQACAVLRTARHICPQALTGIGGHMPTLSPKTFEEPYVDVIVQGEGEQTFHAPKRAQTVDLDTLPAPDRRLLDRYKGRYFYTTARGIVSIIT
jgi:radical SAM superfamily enzyme YgiQ (UPF0313 family)